MGRAVVGVGLGGLGLGVWGLGLGVWGLALGVWGLGLGVCGLGLGVWGLGLGVWGLAVGLCVGNLDLGVVLGVVNGSGSFVIKGPISFGPFLIVPEILLRLAGVVGRLLRFRLLLPFLWPLFLRLLPFC